MSASGLLEGLTVLEISSFVAAPLGVLALAQLGAEIIRIDPIGGSADIGRWPLAPSGTSLFWTGLNKGKRSVTLNFREATGRRILGDLLVFSGSGGGIGGPALADPFRTRPPSPGPHPPADHGVSRRPARGGLHGQRREGLPPDHRTRGIAGAGEPRSACLGCRLRTVCRRRPARRGAAPCRTGTGSAITLALADVALSVAGHSGFLAEAQMHGTDRPGIGIHLYGGLARDFRTAVGERVMVVALTPSLGADTAAVLTGPLGLTEADVATLAERRVVGLPS